jgi:hypothetical protein
VRIHCTVVVGFDSGPFSSSTFTAQICELTPLTRVLLEKLIVPQLDKEFIVFV